MTTTDTTTPTRTLGRSGIEVSALGLGCWAIGGPWLFDGAPAGWSEVDDAESLRALRRARELGVTFFDTASAYGAGHSERLLGEAFRTSREDVVIATKFGFDVDEAGRRAVPYDGDERASDVARRLRADLAASLRRLQTDYLDVYLLHIGGLRVDRALEARDVLEDLVQQGTIRTYGWSSDDTEAVSAFATHPGCGVVEQALSIMEGNADLLALCEQRDLASINRAPLGMGLLTGKFSASSTFAPDDVRHVVQWHPGFADGRPTQEWLDKLAGIRDVLTSDGRTLAQGALAYLWARSPVTIPIPGFKTVAQVEDNCGALPLGPLTPAQRAEIEGILSAAAV
jgi:aryl-alcohol dehydrogenase-like predicted oxidoreductase